VADCAQNELGRHGDGASLEEGGGKQDRIACLTRSDLQVNTVGRVFKHKEEGDRSGL
jgi:hypothetical protein